METHMKAIFPALCGALLLATSLPAAAHQAKAGQFGAGSQRGAVSQANGSTRQFPDRSTFGQIGGVAERRSTIQSLPNAGSSREETGLTSTVKRMDWSTGSTIRTNPHLEQ
jgi:hypothetical protein